jgi:hypothetical protein
MSIINWKELSSEEIKMKLVDMHYEYECLKDSMIKSLNALTIIEKEYNEGNIELEKRNKF